jgi:hypothetical protein
MIISSYPNDEHNFLVLAQRPEALKDGFLLHFQSVKDEEGRKKGCHGVRPHPHIEGMLVGAALEDGRVETEAICGDDSV